MSLIDARNWLSKNFREWKVREGHGVLVIAVRGPIPAWRVVKFDELRPIGVAVFWRNLRWYECLFSRQQWKTITRSRTAERMWEEAGS